MGPYSLAALAILGLILLVGRLRQAFEEGGPIAVLDLIPTDESLSESLGHRDFQRIRDFFGEGGTFRGYFASVGAFFGEGGTFFEEGGPFRSFFSDTIPGFFGEGGPFRSFFASIPGVMGDAFRSGVNAATGFINDLILAWNNLSFSLPSRTFDPFGDFGPSVTFPGLSISTPNIPTIPTLKATGQLYPDEGPVGLAGMQLGGIISRAGSAVVGEAGPEILDFPRGTRVTPLAAGAGTNINITIDNPSITNREEARQLLRRALRELKNEGFEFA